MPFTFTKKTNLGEFNLSLAKSPNGLQISKINDYLSNLDQKIRPVPIAHLSMSRFSLRDSALRILILKILRENTHHSARICRDVLNGDVLLELYSNDTIEKLKQQFSRISVADYTIIPVKNGSQK